MDVAVTTTGRRIEDRLKLAGVKKLPLAGGIDGRQRQRREPPDRAPFRAFSFTPGDVSPTTPGVDVSSKDSVKLWSPHR
jgi:hypothetical protein